MSSAGKNNVIHISSPKCWFTDQRNLIRLVKKYPIAYLPSSTKIANLNEVRLDFVWEEIASKVGQPSRKCKLLWTKIKFKYAKIMSLINTGKITKEAAMSHPNTFRFFDGLLSFLDPYICDTTDEDIPALIHKSVNDLFGLKNTYVKGSHTGDNCHFVTHTQVKSLLRERKLKGEVVVDSIKIEYLQAVVDIAVQRKLGELMKNSSSNDDEDTVNVTMMPNRNEQIMRKRKASSTLNPSENIFNKDEENKTRSNNLGLESEFIIDDDIKTEKEYDIKTEEEDYVTRQDDFYENIQDEDIDKEVTFTLGKKVNNTAVGKCNIENSLPRFQIIEPVVHDMEKNTLRGLNQNAIIIEDNTEEMTDNAPPVTDEYLRNFFSELGVIMTMELSLDRQKILKSRINELLKSNLLKEG